LEENLHIQRSPIRISDGRLNIFAEVSHLLQAFQADAGIIP